MKKNKSIKVVIICIASIFVVGTLFMITGLNKSASNNKKLVEEKVKSKYGITNFKIKTVRRSVYSNTIYKVVLNDGYEFDAYVVRECVDCGITPFGKFETNAYENYAEKYNSEIITKYLDNKNVKYTVGDFFKINPISSYDITVEIESKDIDNFLNDLIKLDSISNGFIKTTNGYTFNSMRVNCNGKTITLRVGDPSDTYNSAYFKEQLNKLK